MQINIDVKGRPYTVELTHMGAFRWMGKWFSDYKLPEDHVLLDDEAFELAIQIQEEMGIKPPTKEEYKKNKNKPKPLPEKEKKWYNRIPFIGA